MFFGMNKKYPDPIVTMNMIQKIELNPSYFWDLSIEFQAVCIKKCRQSPCLTTEFNSFIQETKYLPFAEFNKTQTLSHANARIEIMRPSEPETIYFHEPKINMAEYLSLAGGSIVLWFGLSARKLYKRIQEFTKDFRAKRKLPAPVKVRRRRKTPSFIVLNDHIHPKTDANLSYHNLYRLQK